MSLFKGSGAALVTPFNAGGVNLDALGKLIDFVIDGGTDALFVLGTTGEPSTMTRAEKERVLEFSIARAAKRAPVFAGSGANDTLAAVEQSKRFADMGADGLLVVTPYYNKCTQNGCVAHYAAVSDAVKIPIVAYNVPTRTGFNIAPATAARLADIKNVRALKEAGGDIDQIIEVAKLLHDKMDWYSGDDSLTVPCMSLGAKGVISVAANVIPKQVRDMTALCLSGDYPGAAELQFKILAFVKTLFKEVNPIPCKKALQFIGIDAGVPRLPLTEMEKANADILFGEMKKIGLVR
ncbi:MAG: 4-hydroxy-tetrahydrodipicolinate synthase [Clostridiales bacterium]|jgi:4-hydroxy-tetrahydrodipicolinate synthase|nr:4-hydroxy-tetrahydrodipicolinate synthase [Clostridiales bacterium]